MRKLLRVLPLIGVIAGLGAGAPASAAGPNQSAEEMGPVPQAVGNPVLENLTFNTPFDVIQIRAQTPGVYLNIDTQDCCIAGDLWTARTFCLQNGGIWDVKGKGNGGTTVYTGRTWVYKRGPQGIDCITEIRYGEGVAIFPAGMSVRFGTTTGDSVTTTIQTTTVPLP